MMITQYITMPVRFFLTQLLKTDMFAHVKCLCDGWS